MNAISTSSKPAVAPQKIKVKTSSAESNQNLRDKYVSEKVGVGSVVGKRVSGSDIKPLTLSSNGKSDEVEEVFFAVPFQYLNLGVLAYLGASQALAQVSMFLPSISVAMVSNA